MQPDRHPADTHVKPSFSLCQLSFPDTGFEEDVEMARAVGACGLGVAEAKLAPIGTAAAQRLLDAARLAVPLAVPVTWTILPPRGGAFPAVPADPAERIEQIRGSIETLAALGARTVLIASGPAGDLPSEEARRIVVEALRSLAATARAVGTRVSIEPMREDFFRAIRTIVTSLGETLDLLSEVGVDDVGFVLDFWHLWDSPGLRELLATALPWAHAVQVADYRDPTRGPMDRVPAGEGIARLPELIRLVHEAGYDGWYDLEIFSDDGRYGADYEDSLWKLDPVEFARRQADGFRRCWNAAGAGSGAG